MMRQQIRLIAAALALFMVAVACATTPLSSAGPRPACRAPYPIGYQVVPFSGGRSMAVWYPSNGAQAPFSYSADISSTLAFNGRPLTGCGTFPLVVFSHGLGGCGVQSIFFTETLARQGYVVAAPDHADAAFCHLGNAAGTPSTQSEPSVYSPQIWNDSSYVDRRDDVELVIAQMLAGAWGGIVDPSEIGMAGHSLGGYTALAMAGGWSSWRDARIKAALLFSPYSLPFSIKGTLGGVQVPLMYQGADGDLGITPYVEGPNGAYGQSNAPKYFVKLRGGNHLSWSNAVCAGHRAVADCLASIPDAALIDAYGIAFLNKYLKQQSSAILVGPGTGLSAYAAQP